MMEQVVVSSKTAERLQLLERSVQGDHLEEMRIDVASGLARTQKELSPKYFYDKRGSELFEEITRLEEYYQTRTEKQILNAIVGELAELYGFTDLIEFGSGNSEKTRLLLEVLGDRGSLQTYHPIDVSRTFLLDTAETLLNDFPTLELRPVVGDFAGGLDGVESAGPALAIFLGGTIGNLYRHEAIEFLRQVRAGMRPDDAFLIGLDLVKDPARLHAAYNDPQGVTAAFNRNVLHVINRDLDGTFNPELFDHYAFYNPEDQRIEMHLMSRVEQNVPIGALGTSVRFREGETIRTEISRKFTRESAEELLGTSGFTLRSWFTDENALFALALVVPTEVAA